MLYLLTDEQARSAAFALVEEAARQRKQAAHRMRQAQALAQAHNRLGFAHGLARLRLDQAGQHEARARQADQARHQLTTAGGCHA